MLADFVWCLERYVKIDLRVVGVDQPFQSLGETLRSRTHVRKHYKTSLWLAIRLDLLLCALILDELVNLSLDDMSWIFVLSEDLSQLYDLFVSSARLATNLPNSTP